MQRKFLLRDHRLVLEHLLVLRRQHVVGLHRLHRLHFAQRSVVLEQRFWILTQQQPQERTLIEQPGLALHPRRATHALLHSHHKLRIRRRQRRLCVREPPQNETTVSTALATAVAVEPIQLVMEADKPLVACLAEQLAQILPGHQAPLVMLQDPTATVRLEQVSLDQRLVARDGRDHARDRLARQECLGERGRHVGRRQPATPLALKQRTDRHGWQRLVRLATILLRLGRIDVAQPHALRLEHKATRVCLVHRVCHGDQSLQKLYLGIAAKILPQFLDRKTTV